jgi:transcription-repair coupling factor (superfamily II helicase)
LRREASRLGIISIDREGDRLAVKFSEQARINPEKLIALVSSNAGAFTPSGVLKMGLKAETDAALFAEVRELLDHLR